MRWISGWTQKTRGNTGAGRKGDGVLLACLCSVGLFSVSSAFAETVTVNTASDIEDGDTSSISALIGTPGGDGVISLREAITAANNTTNSGGPDEIHFSIGSGLQTITPGTELPYLLDPVILDATTQPGYAGDPLIQLDGSAASGATAGITLRANDCTVRGFIVHSFDDEGIEMDASTGFGDTNIIQNNWVGIDAAGSAQPNGEYGVMITVGADHNQIGGTDPNDGNVIAGNASTGLIIRNSGSNNNTVQGNIIGLGPDGFTVVPNQADGILIMDEAGGNIIGGTTAAARNIISGNLYSGIRIDSDAGSGNVIMGNYIGVAADGTTPAGNSDDGVSIKAMKTTFGGIAAGAGNIVANHLAATSVGVWVTDGATGVSILGNSIYNNAEDGIGLGPPYGPVPNDDGDADTGNNNLQNYPVLTNAVTDEGGSVYIEGTLNSIASTTFRIEFFSNATGDGSGYGEGQNFLGSVEVTTDGSGNASFGTSLTATVPGGSAISATATKKNGDSTYSDTSQFSLNTTAIAGSLTVTTTNDALNGNTSSIAALIANNGGDGISLREAIAAANNTTNVDGSTPDEISFDITGSFPPHTIQPGSALPTISDAVVIDGTSEPDYAGTPVVELNGTGAGAGADGLALGAGSEGSTIQGLAINRFTGNGLQIAGTSSGSTLSSNHIGTDPAGVVARPNTLAAIHLDDSRGNTIGGTGTDRNVIAGNSSDGVQLTGDSDGNIVQGNYIGIDITGNTILANGGEGIQIDLAADGNLIGGSGAGQGNIIGGNADGGIRIQGGNNNIFRGNFIGTDASGTVDLGNGLIGIAVQDGGSGNSIGGTAAGLGNVVAYNQGWGVRILSTAGVQNPIVGNSIFGNDQLGIDLDDPADPVSGVTANDAGDGDTGANGLQNYPVLSSAVTDEVGSITVDGSLNSTPSTTFRVEFFANSFADASGYGEGEIYLGSTDVVTDAVGDVSFSVPLAVTVAVGEGISATATSLPRETSEFALTIAATSSLHAVSGTVFEDVDFAGSASGWDGGAGDLGLANVDVELYNGADTYLTSTATAGDGSFSFSGLSDGNYKVRVRSGTLGDADSPPAGGLNVGVPGTWPYPLAEMTWGKGAALIGGQDPAVDDTATGDDAGPGDTWVPVTVSGADVSGLDFGFSYNVIVNQDDDTNADSVRSKQGCLRQFIKNSNAISGVNKSWFQISGI